MARFLGVPYPTSKNPRGYWYSQGGISQIKSDMLALLLTNPGERVMLPEFGTPLKRLFFEPNDSTIEVTARNMIIASIQKWEPRVAITNIEVYSGSNINDDSLNINDDLSQKEHILLIKISFVDPENIKVIQELSLQVPMT